MNMRRGCQVRGFLNMRTLELKAKSERLKAAKVDNFDNNLTHHSRFVTRYHIVRPLLSYSKKEIQDYCDEHKIPYMIDQSNVDPSVSQRNKIRHEIVMKLSDQELANRQ
jgi:tRNA(Ile)-lysidine synthase TilS/MesJ